MTANNGGHPNDFERPEIMYNSEHFQDAQSPDNDTGNVTGKQPSLLKAALSWAELGYVIFPCKENKTPHISGGFKAASKDREQICSWWADWPNALIGMPTGKQNGFFVLDVDIKPDKNGVPAKGEESLAALENKYGKLPDTVETRTMSGGRHLYFRHVDGVRNSASMIGLGLDIRGEGGYVIFPPSPGYAFTRRDVDYQYAPEWLVDLAKKKTKPDKPAAAPSMPLSNSSGRASTGSDGNWIVERMLIPLKGGEHGTRNDTLNQCAFFAGQLVAAGVPLPDVESRIKACAKEVGLDDAEIDATFQSGFESGQKEPSREPLTYLKKERIRELADLPSVELAGVIKSEANLLGIPLTALRNEIVHARVAKNTRETEAGGSFTEDDSGGGFPGGGGDFILRDKDDEKKAGVYFIGLDSQGEKIAPKFVCSPLRVLAHTRNNAGETWGYLLQWRDRDEKIHVWACPADLFAGDGLELRKALLSGGLRLSSAKNARVQLESYIQSFPTKKYARCTDKPGWHGGCYVLPNETIGAAEDDEIVVYQSSHYIKPAFSISGTVEQWRDHVATLAAGNSRAVFAISAAFAGTLLDVVGMEGGGFHLCGKSSKGKTISQFAMASVWGSPKFKRSWRTTTNALESMATLHNDGCLILDEIGEMTNPAELGAAAYMLANGTAKGRAAASGAGREIATWKLIFLSSGEDGLSDLMQQSGKRIHAGQEVRLAEIPIGDFENIHGYATPGEFADSLQGNAGKFFGAAGIEFLRNLVEKRDELTQWVNGCIGGFVSNSDIVPAKSSGQVRRVAKRFALVAAAGELATDLGLTGWRAGESFDAAAACFAGWLEKFGTGLHEEKTALSQVRAFFELHSDSRFSDVTEKDRPIHNRAGFYRVDGFGEDEKRTYYVLPEVFRNELCRGLNLKTATETLVNAGWIEPGNDRITQKQRIFAMGKTSTWVFVFNAEKIFGS